MSARADDSFRSWTFEDAKAALLRRSRVVIVCFLALSAGAVAAVIVAPRVYEGQLKILVKQDREDSVVSGAADHAAARSELSETELLSQVELIKAQDLLEKVAAEAELTKRITAAGTAHDDAEALALATTSLRRDLTVAPIKRTWLIDVTYRSKERPLTKNVLDTLMRTGPRTRTSHVMCWIRSCACTSRSIWRFTARPGPIGSSPSSPNARGWSWRAHRKGSRSSVRETTWCRLPWSGKACSRSSWSSTACDRRPRRC